MFNVRRMRPFLLCGVLSLLTASHRADATVVYLTSGTTTWTVPNDWNSSTNTVEAIGAGGNGTAGGSGGSGAGGGGGAYAAISDFSASAGTVINVSIGAGGSGTATQFNSSTTLVAKAGANGGAGGAASTSVGTTKYSGGSGGAGITYGAAGGGAGGAAGPHGAGGAGAIAGSAGAGDNGYGGAAGTTASNSNGGNGGNGTEYDSTHGCGGGGGGGQGSTHPGGNGGNYGGGGGGGGAAYQVGGAAGGSGAPGLIIITYTPIPLPSAPSGLTATGGNGQASLSWTAGTGATSYDIYYSTTSGGELSGTEITGITGTSDTVTGLTAGTTYYFEVESVNGAGTSGVSNEAYSLSLSATGGDDQVLLNWSASSDATSYNVYRGTASGGETLLASGVATNSYTDTGLSTGSAYYYYEVAGVGSAGTSGVSNEAKAATTSQLVFSGYSTTVYSAETFSFTLTAEDQYGNTTQDFTDDIAFGSTDGDAELPSSTSTLTNGTGSFDATLYTVGTQTITAASTTNSSITGTTSSITVSAPWTLSVVGGTNSVALSWTSVTGATSYTIYRGFSEGSETSYQTGVTGTSYNDTGLTNGTIYWYYMTALNSSGVVIDTSEQVGARAIAAPSGLTTVGGNGVVSLSWSPVSFTGYYNVYRGTTSGGETLLATDVTSPVYNDTTVVNGTTYYYEVAALITPGPNEYSQSSNSSEASTTPSSSLPDSPTNLVAVPTATEIQLIWSAAGGATGYNVERATSSGGPYTSVGTTSNTTYTDTGVSGSGTFYYVVIGVNSSGDSGFSNEANVSLAGVTTLGDIANTYSQQNLATTNFGGTEYLKSRNHTASDANSYLRFDISPAGGAITSATLKLYGANPYPVTDAVYSVSDNTWTEFGLDWDNAPSLGTELSTQSITSTNQYYSWDVSTYMGTEQGDGDSLVSLGVGTITTPPGPYFSRYYSKERYQDHPQLLLNIGGPLVPSGLAATAGSGQVTLNWTSDNTAAAYNIYRSTTSGGEGATPYATGVTGTSYVDTSVTSGITYYYTITATNIAGESAQSSETSATPS